MSTEGSPGEKIRVLIVDDSTMVRGVLKDKLSSHPRIRVTATAGDPFQARQVLEAQPVDVVILDIHMPRMDGLTFLKYLMKYNPLPVIVFSSLTDKANQASMEAMELGAVGVFPKPDGLWAFDNLIEGLVELILECPGIDKTKLGPSSLPARDATKRPAPISHATATRRLVAVGASTGGPQALESLFLDFEPDFPPVLVVVHMPERFTQSFAQRLNQIVPMRVKEAENNETIEAGTIYIAPGNFHMTLHVSGRDRILRVTSGPKIFHQRPSVDVLFDSVAAVAGKDALGVLLTGMGKDGASGLLAMRSAGSHTVAQDEASSVVFGMPREAVALGAAVEVLPLNQIASGLKKRLF